MIQEESQTQVSLLQKLAQYSVTKMIQRNRFDAQIKMQIEHKFLILKRFFSRDVTASTRKSRHEWLIRLFTMEKTRNIVAMRKQKIVSLNNALSYP